MTKLNPPSGIYDLSGLHHDGEPYNGTLDISDDGDAYLLSWQMQGRDATRNTMFSGVGFVTGNLLVAGRSPINFPPLPSVGVVVYDISKKGTLPARWYHNNLKGKLGQGLSTEGPSDSLTGTYVAEYGSQNEEFTPLRKEVITHGKGFHFRWLQGQETMFIGVGFSLGLSMFCAWGTPRQEIDVLVYQVSRNGELDSEWCALSGDGANFGTESAVLRSRS